MNQNLPGNRIAAAGLVLLLGATAAGAQEGRFVMERTDGGFVRLDTFTGEISACTEVEGQIVCRMAADERRALEEQIDTLEDRIEELEAAVAELPEGRRNQLPTDEEIDRTFGVMEKLMRRFLGVIEEFEKETGDKAPPQPAPEKTLLR